MIVFDASWNPSNDTQAVFRAYRYGQTKPVFVYRLIAEGFEQCLYRQQVVKLQLAGRVLDEQTHDSTFTKEELKDLWRPIPFTPPAPPSQHAHAISQLPREAWLSDVAQSCGTFLLAVDDHDKVPLMTSDGRRWPLMTTERTLMAPDGLSDRLSDPLRTQRLEGEEEQLNTVDQEDAENDLFKDLNLMPRDHAICEFCQHDHSNIQWSHLSMTCIKCKALCLLPPAAPLVKRMETAGHLHFTMHGEECGLQSNGVTLPKRSCIQDAGVYHVQWRGFDGETTPGPDDEWRNPKKCVKPSSIISKKNLSDQMRYQVRVRARLGACQCGRDIPSEDYGFLKCADPNLPGGCLWTPWSAPSAVATPVAPPVAPVAPEASAAP